MTWALSFLDVWKLSAVACRLRVSIPEVGAVDGAVREDDLVLVPDAVPAVRQRSARRTTGADPLDLVVPALLTTVRYLTVPLIVGPGTGAVLGSAVGVAVLPRAVPLHDEVVVGVGRVTPDLAIEHAVDAVGSTVEDASDLVVAVLVEGRSRVLDQGASQGSRERLLGASADHEGEEEGEGHQETLHHPVTPK